MYANVTRYFAFKQWLAPLMELQANVLSREFFDVVVFTCRYMLILSFLSAKNGSAFSLTTNAEIFMERFLSRHLEQHFVELDLWHSRLH